MDDGDDDDDVIDVDDKTSKIRQQTSNLSLPNAAFNDGVGVGNGNGVNDTRWKLFSSAVELTENENSGYDIFRPFVHRPNVSQPNIIESVQSSVYDKK